MDIVKSFMLENGLFRGSYIAADDTVNDIWNRHAYPAELRPLLCEAVLTALALSAGIKYQGVFSLQLKGNGPVLSLFTDITDDKKVRAYLTLAEGADLTNRTTLPELFGQGRLIFSVAGLGQEPYQGVVALRHDTLAEVVRDYFALSEQIDTDIILRRRGHSGRCILLQRMPNKADVPEATAADLWETVGVLLNSIQNSELFSDKLTPDEILFRLFHANKLTVFEPKKPMFECRCYRGKMERFLRQMSAKERADLYNADGVIETACQFCGEKYTFTRAELED